MKKLIITSLAITGLGISTAALYPTLRYAHLPTAPQPAADQGDGPLLSTITAVSLDMPRSVVYCPTFTVAWQELTKRFDLYKPTPLTQTLNDESRAFSRDALPTDSYYADGGTIAEGIKTRVQSKHAAMFDEQLQISVENPEDVVLYCGLKHELEFRWEFIDTDLPQPFYPNRTTNQADVEPFSGRYNYFEGNFVDQIDVIHYDTDDYILRLKTKTPGDSIVLAMFAEKPATLQNAIVATEKKLNLWDLQQKQTPQQNPLPLNPSKDTILVPYISLQQHRSFPKLINRKLLIKKTDSVIYKICQAQQKVDFSLSKKGAKVSSYAMIEMISESSVPKRVSPRDFHFDRPFLCTMWKDGEAMPYLAIWVNGPDVLVK